jgi:hypothetical protein
MQSIQATEYCQGTLGLLRQVEELVQAREGQRFGVEPRARDALKLDARADDDSGQSRARRRCR